MPKHFKWLLLLSEIAIAFLLAGCPSQLQGGGAPPYAITKPVYRIAGPDDVCSLGGIFFDFYNKTEKEVVFIETCMNVFDKSTGELAFAGAAGLSCGASCSIEKKARKNLCIPLDDYLYQTDDLLLCPDNFFVKKIKYADGSIWQDWQGLYAYSSREET